MFLLGDCIEVMRTLPDNSVDSVVTDPPYDLTANKRGGPSKAKGGFMGKEWDGTGIAFKVETWREVYRVLKPGGHILAFGGTRTYHRMAVAIEDAGFEIRDSLMWLYGSGFPKSLSVSKAIDKAAGAEREIVGPRTYADGTTGHYGPMHAGYERPMTRRMTDGALPKMNTAPATPEAQQWDGWGTSLKPAFEPVVLARKPFKGTVAANVLQHGTGAINVDGCRVGSGGQLQWAEPRDMGYHGGTDNGSVPAMQNNQGRWPANVILSHHPACVMVGTRDVKGYQINRFTDGAKPFGNGAGHEYTSEQQPDESQEVWDCHDDCPVAILDAQSGPRKSGGKVKGHEPSRTGQNGIYGHYERVENQPHKDTGTASRFFYQAKTSKSERNKGMMDGEVNDHATVKPVGLMRYLVRLVTPPSGVVLDPFVGSGTTAIACKLEGFDCIGIDKEEHHLEIAEKRLMAW